MQTRLFDRIPGEAFIWLLVLSIFLAGCGKLTPRQPVPLSFQPLPEVVGFTDIRFYGDAIPPQIEKRVQTMTTPEVRSAFRPSLASRTTTWPFPAAVPTALSEPGCWRAGPGRAVGLSFRWSPGSAPVP